MKKYNRSMLSIRKLLLLLLCVAHALSACVKPDVTGDLSDTEASRLALNAELAASKDMGDEYIDSIIFIGESTTYHLKSREVLKNGRNTRQVWSTSAGTMTLDMGIVDVRIVYPDTLEEITIGEAAARKKPEIFVLTFGLNGVVGKIKRGEEYYKSCYMALVNEIKSNSPDSKIIIQACPPVAENMDVSAYSVNVSTLNEYIDVLNAWAREMCAEQGIYYLASDSVLKDERGYLADEYQAGDGYHLTAAAYEKMLYYIRTHGIVSEEK